jgi:hypothetical protein
MLRKITGFLNHLTLRAYVALQVLAAQEPVRIRAALTSLVLAGGILVPALRDGGVAETVAGIGAVALPTLVGELTRAKVTPAQ